MTRRTPAQYKWSALEFDETILTKHFTSPRSLKIAFVVVHHMTIIGDGTGKALTGCYNTWQTREASAHYGVEEGLVRQFVWDRDAAWATANRTGNHAGISIEHANISTDPEWRVSDKTWKTGARLAAHIHKVYKLGRPVKDKTLRRHKDFYATACPGPYINSIWSKYVAEAQRVYDEITAPAPVPPVDPPTTGPEVVSASLNAASYNALGARTYKGRVDRYVARRLKYLVDVLNFQEVGNGINRASKPNCLMRDRLDTKFGATYKRRGGSDGRYNYTNLLRVKHVKSGVITAARSTWFNGDDKQASWEVFEKDGVRAMDVSAHLENEDGVVADAKRVASMLNIVAQALAIAKTLNVDIRNIMFTGDTNSAGMVAAAMKAAGWRNAATGTEYESAYTFMGWDGRSRERYDYAFVHTTAAEAAVTAVHHDTDISDHAELVVRRRLTRV